MPSVRESLELVPGGALGDFTKAEIFPSLMWSSQKKLEQIHRQFICVASLLQEQQSQNNNRYKME